MQEVWKDIDGYEGLYQVSNHGRVKSLNYKRTGKAKVLSLKENNCGRMHVEIRRDGKKKDFLVHRLVASAFIPNPNNYPEINHMDENPKNNATWNLEWCTGLYNVRYSTARHPERALNRKPTDKYGRRLDLMIEQIDASGSTVKIWQNSRTIFSETGMSDWSISECCRGKRKTAYGYIWRYVS